MKVVYNNKNSGGEIRLMDGEPVFDRTFYGKDRKDKLLTIAWNRGASQPIMIDQVPYEFPADSILCLMVNQSFKFSGSTDIVAWQFNRDFYCIVDHDHEVSCVGFLFYGGSRIMFISLDKQHRSKIDLLLQVFHDEFATDDNVQEEMLRTLLKRLIIIVTRLAREQYLDSRKINSQQLDVIRQFNLLVENHYKTQHSVGFYAAQINRSPKTLANLFALYHHQSPLAVIQERVILEAKRLLLYTDKSSKQIAYELGFEDAAYFSSFFKKNTAVNPSDFRRQRFK
jgi:AraC-like DNA-binding protein